MKRIIGSLVIISGVLALGVAGTRAFFSDSETSTGNVLQAGSIDLKIDNTSYYNGVYNPGTSWLTAVDLTDELFFNFLDLKPGDYGEDTISIHVDDNPSWLCADVTLTSDAENSVTEPEDDLADTGPTGELADGVNFIWWADDGDNVLEDNETTLPSGPLGVLSAGQSATVALADSQTNIWSPGPSPSPFPGAVTRYIGKAWCYGDIVQTPVAQDGQGALGTPGEIGSNGPDFRTAGFTCDGTLVTNIGQSDSLTADISFRSVQARHNDQFVCAPLPTVVPSPTPTEVPLPSPTGE